MVGKNCLSISFGINVHYPLRDNFIELKGGLNKKNEKINEKES